MMIETTGAFTQYEEMRSKSGDVLEGVRRPRFMAEEGRKGGRKEPVVKHYLIQTLRKGGRLNRN